MEYFSLILGAGRRRSFLIRIVGVFALYAGLGQLFPKNLGLIMILRFIRYSQSASGPWWGPMLFRNLHWRNRPYLPEQVK